MVGAAYSNPILSNHKAISALFPYAIRLGQRGDEGMTIAVLFAAGTSGSRRFNWHHAGPYIAELFNEPIPPSPKYKAGGGSCFHVLLCSLSYAKGSKYSDDVSH